MINFRLILVVFRGLIVNNSCRKKKNKLDDNYYCFVVVCCSDGKNLFSWELDEIVKGDDKTILIIHFLKTQNRYWFGNEGDVFV